MKAQRSNGIAAYVAAVHNGKLTIGFTVNQTRTVFDNNAVTVRLRPMLAIRGAVASWARRIALLMFAAAPSVILIIHST
jgi:hypothetical protein